MPPGGIEIALCNGNGPDDTMVLTPDGKLHHKAPANGPARRSSVRLCRRRHRRRAAAVAGYRRARLRPRRRRSCTHRVRPSPAAGSPHRRRPPPDRRPRLNRRRVSRPFVFQQGNFFVTISKRALWRASLAVLASTIAMPAWAADPDDDQRRDDITDHRRSASAPIAPSPAHHRLDRRRYDRAHGQRDERRGHDQISAQPDRAQTPYRRHAGAAGDAHLGARRERAQPDLRRRRVAVGADRQQQHQRLAQMEPGQPAGDRADRRALRPVFGGLSGQFDRRGGQHHARGCPTSSKARSPRAPASRPSTCTAAATPIRPISSARRSATGSGRSRCSPATTMSTSRGQPLGYVTATGASDRSATGTVVTARCADLNRTGQPIRVLGASGIEDQAQDRLKLKAALDLTRAHPPDLCRRAVPQPHRCAAPKAI